MAIYVNGIKVAGRGISGKSPYQIAVSEGYTGTEAEFNAQLAAIGEAVAGFDELSNQVDNAKADIEAAVQQAQQVKSDVQTTVNQAKADIEAAKEDAINAIPNAENLATIDYVNQKTAAIVTDIWYYGSTAPENKKLLWIDSNSSTGGLKFYKSDSDGWIHVPVAWQ